MRGREELVKAWVKKAEGDINAAEARDAAWTRGFLHELPVL